MVLYGANFGPGLSFAEDETLQVASLLNGVKVLEAVWSDDVSTLILILALL